VQGIKRKVVYVSVFEAIAIEVCIIGFAALTDRSLGH
jgi:uncharacterized membrane protein